MILWVSDNLYIRWLTFSAFRESWDKDVFPNWFFTRSNNTQGDKFFVLFGFEVSIFD